MVVRSRGPLSLPLSISLLVCFLSHFTALSLILHINSISNSKRGRNMDTTPHQCLILLFLTLIVSAPQGSRIEARHQTFQRKIHMQAHSEGAIYPRRAMIGSSAPTCTYNECRGCKHKCSAEQVPVEGNDPINSAYYYRCICHRY